MIASALLGQLVPPQLELEKALRTPKANQERQLAIYHEFRNRQWPASGEQCASNIVAFDGSGEEPGSLWGMGSGWGSHFGHLLGNAGRVALLREAVLVQKAHPVWLWSPDGKGVELLEGTSGVAHVGRWQRRLPEY